MFFLEKRTKIIKSIKDAAGLSNSSCVMPFYIKGWKQIAVCEEKEPLQEIIDSQPIEERKNYRITSNMLESEVK